MKNNIYFKVYKDFNRYVPIKADEYEKALYAFIKGRPAIFENGAVSRIESILPDLNRMCGWYSDYKPNQDDNAEIDRAKNMVKPFMIKTKEKVEYLMETKQEHLIGKNVEIPELNKPENPQISEVIKRLSDKLKIK